jgi:type IV pilus assembly protein PilC
VSGAVRAASPLSAIIDLRRRALFVTSISKSSGRRSRHFSWGRRRALLGFFRAFATLLRCGITIRRGLSVAIDQVTDQNLRESLRAVLADVEEGSSLSSALERRPGEFSPLQVAMIGAAETGGVLDRVTERIAEVLDREHALRKRLQGAIAYPAIVALVAGTLVLFMLLHIIPMFAAMFERFGAPLPLPTRVLLEVRSVIVSPALWILGAPACTAIAFMLTLLRGSPAERLDRVRLQIPLVGRLFKAAATARVTRMLGVLVSSDVGILKAMEVVAPVAGSLVYARALTAVAAALQRGEGLRSAMAATRLFEPLVLALIGVGEESGALDEMFIAAAGYLEIELEAAVTALAALVEPTLIGCLGLLVAVIVFSIFLPLYSLIGSIA